LAKLLGCPELDQLGGEHVPAPARRTAREQDGRRSDVLEGERATGQLRARAFRTISDSDRLSADGTPIVFCAGA